MSPCRLSSSLRSASVLLGFGVNPSDLNLESMPSEPPCLDLSLEKRKEYMLAGIVLQSLRESPQPTMCRMDGARDSRGDAAECSHFSSCRSTGGSKLRSPDTFHTGSPWVSRPQIAASRPPITTPIWHQDSLQHMPTPQSKFCSIRRAIVNLESANTHPSLKQRTEPTVASPRLKMPSKAIQAWSTTEITGYSGLSHRRYSCVWLTCSVTYRHIPVGLVRVLSCCFRSTSDASPRCEQQSQHQNKLDFFTHDCALAEPFAAIP